VPPASNGIRISCIINFYGRLDLLSGILYSLAQQSFPREKFEVVLVEDKGGTEEGKRIADEFSLFFPVVYAPLDRNFGHMGYSRNYALSRCRGEYVLFLDDDTVILQKDFLRTLEENSVTIMKLTRLFPGGTPALPSSRESMIFTIPIS